MILKAKELISFKSEKERKIVFALLGTVPLLLKVHPEEEFHFHQSQQKTHPVAEFKEFKRRFKFKPRFKYG